MDNSKLLQELNLTARLPCMAPHRIMHLKCGPLASSTLWEWHGAWTEVCQHHVPRCYPLFYGPQLLILTSLLFWLSYSVITRISFRSLSRYF